MPDPAALSTVSEPPIAPTRSAMLTKPWPRTALLVASKPAPLSATSKHSSPVALLDRDRDARAFARVLARVLQRLEAAEVDRRLDVGRVAADVRVHVGDEHGAVRGGAQRFAEAAVHEQRRVDAVRELAQLR